MRRDAVERGAHLGRHEQPGARRIVADRTGSTSAPRATRPRSTGAVPRACSSSVGCRRGARSDDHGRIHRGVERARRLRPVLESQQPGVAREERARAAAGERAPELRRHQQRDDAAGSGEREAPLDEQRGEIDLRAEASARACTLGAGRPRGVAEDGIAFAQRRARGGGDVVQPHPRRIADDELEAAARVDVSEVRREGEGQRATRRRCARARDGARPARRRSASESPRLSVAAPPRLPKRSALRIAITRSRRSACSAASRRSIAAIARRRSSRSSARRSVALRAPVARA